jgi:hypothetical protein
LNSIFEVGLKAFFPTHVNDKVLAINVRAVTAHFSEHVGECPVAL